MFKIAFKSWKLIKNDKFMNKNIQYKLQLIVIMIYFRYKQILPKITEENVTSVGAADLKLF